MLSNLLTLASLASLATAAPAAIKKRNNDGSSNSGMADIDTTILQYALTLEHLEYTFYTEALTKYDNAAFNSAGYPTWVRERLVQVCDQEGQHVSLLSGAIGDNATAKCEYSFPYTDVSSFLGLAATIENVGVSAYLGAAHLITNPDYITVAGSILTTEARHQTWINSAAMTGTPWSGPEDTPLGFSPVYSLVAPFITSCPDSNPMLPVTNFPQASITTENPMPGDTVKLDFKTTGQTEFLIVYHGLMTYAAPISVDAMVSLPKELMGTSYAIISTAAAAEQVTTENTVAGPIIINVGLLASASGV